MPRQVVAQEADLATILEAISRSQRQITEQLSLYEAKLDELKARGNNAIHTDALDELRYQSNRLSEVRQTLLSLAARLQHGIDKSAATLAGLEQGMQLIDSELVRVRQFIEARSAKRQAVDHSKKTCWL